MLRETLSAGVAIASSNLQLEFFFISKRERVILDTITPALSGM